MPKMRKYLPHFRSITKPGGPGSVRSSREGPQLRPILASRIATAVCATLFALACGAGPDLLIADAQELQENLLFSDSIEPLRDALSQRPNDAQANFLLGTALFRTGQISAAVWPLRSASESPEFAIDAGAVAGASTWSAADERDRPVVAAGVPDAQMSARAPPSWPEDEGG